MPVLLSMAVACGPFFGIGRSTWLRCSPSRSGQSDSFTSRARFTTARVWAWKKSGNQTSSVNTRKVRDDVRVRGRPPSWFCGLLPTPDPLQLLLHSLLPHHDPNINTTKPFCYDCVRRVSSAGHKSGDWTMLCRELRKSNIFIAKTYF